MAAEKQFEKKVEKYLTKIWGGGYQKSGIPDLILCVNGIFISVELKAPNGRPSELQKLNTSRINQSGGISIILKPDGFEQFKKIMEGVISCRCHIQELKHLKTVHSDTKCDILTKYKP